MTRHILTIECPDGPGIVASIANGLVDIGANIIENAQFSDEATNRFCMRTRFDCDLEDPADVRAALADRAAALDASLRVRLESDHLRAIVMVSKADHCLLDLLYRHEENELPVDIPLVISNHTDLGEMVTRHGIPFEHVPVPTTNDRPAAEARLLQLVDDHDVDLVILARYMQILSSDVCEALAGRIINIHHSFLPGFKGARPYRQAWDRGVKMIGATAHYATAELDDGPIIAQDVSPVNHALDPEQLQIVGRDLERLVLSRAVKAHAEDRVFLMDHRTVVFS